MIHQDFPSACPACGALMKVESEIVPTGSGRQFRVRASCREHGVPAGWENS